jgi:DNA primase large subunit
MIKIGTDEMAKYPFLPEAGQYLKDKDFSLDQFGTDQNLKPIVDKAYSRIETAIENPNYNSKPINSEKLDLEVFSFLIAIILLKLCGKITLIKRFSLAEARRAEKFLEKDLGTLSTPTEEELAKRIIKDLFSISIEKKNDSLMIPISDYVIHSVKFHEREWKLINRHVENGMVYLTSHETVRLIRKELDNYINSRIISSTTPSMISGFQSNVEKLSLFAKKYYVPTIVSSEYPPCIKHAIDVLEKGENLPHSGRFMLATYLLGVEQTVQQIAPLFKNAPDYNEKITLYQLNHLKGSSGSGTEYKCPSCEKIKSKDLCFATSDCDNIIHPLQFNKKKTVNV